MRKFFFVTLALFATHRLAADETVRGVEGRWPIVNITPEQAREKAIERAKQEALRRAGIAESVKSAKVLATTEGGGASDEQFASFTSVELRGAITAFTVVKDEKVMDELDGNLYAVVTIDATVKKYRTQPDPELTFDVQGLRSNGYRAGEAITFSIRPNKAGYLKIFLFEGGESASQIFPNEYEKNRCLAAKQAVAFPTVGIDYTATKSTAAKREQNTLLFVLTKSDIPFYETPTFSHILGWVNGMEPDERAVKVEAVLISE